jgi:Tfp pilus assembly protein PilF
MGLTIIYDFEPVRSASEPLFIIGLLACGAFAALAFYARKNRRVLFFLLWILVPILPVLYMPILSVGGFADRYLYLSTVGFACLAGLIVARAGERQGGWILTPAMTTTLAAVIIVVYAGAAFSRGLVWRNDLTLWSDTVKKSPQSPNALYNLAWTLHQRAEPGDKDRALALYEEALRIKPNKEDAHYNAALIYQERGQYRKALEHFLASLRLRPDYSTTYYNIAMTLQTMGRTKRAIEFYEGALRIDPAYEDAHYNLAWAYQDMGRYDKALVHYREVLRLNPRSVDALYNMGVIYEEQGRAREALAQYMRALAIDPSYGPARLRASRLRSKAN